MFAAIVGLLAAGLVLGAAVLLWGARLSLRDARSAEIARRIGPVDTLPRLVAARQPDGLATALGAFGAWLHGLRGRAGRGGSAAAVLAPALAFATVGVAALAKALSFWPQALDFYLQLGGWSRRGQPSSRHPKPDHTNIVRRHQ